MHMFHWWVDAAFAVHTYLKINMRLIMSIGKGEFTCMSKNQNNNTSSSNKVELVGVDGAIPHMIWTDIFVSSQCVTPKASIMYHYNSSSICLEFNEKISP